MARQPNILLIVSDQHRADWISVAGQAFVRTPNLDALSARGARFTNAYCSYPLCAPSRMSLITGRHPYRLGVYINEQCLSSDIPTFAHALGIAGYETVLAGRMHFMGPDQRHGFEHRLVGDICRCYPGGPDTDYGDAKGAASSAAFAAQNAHAGDSLVLEYDRAVTQAAEEYLRRPRTTSDRPLFMTVGWYGPHHPFTAPPDLYQQAKARMQGKDRPVPLPTELHPFHAQHRKGQKEDQVTAEQTAEARYNYAAMIEHMDQLLGRVLSAAESLLGETIIIYISDHGESAGDMGLWGKIHFHDSCLKVPFIVAPLKAGATQIPQVSKTIEYPISLLDLSPTLTDLASAKPLPLQDGLSLLPLLTQTAANATAWENRPIFAEMELVFRTPIFEPGRAVRRGDYKLIYYHNLRPLQLFNLQNDPAEQHNLAEDPRYAALRDELFQLVMTDWNPEALKADALAKGRDLAYLWEWGEKIGMGELDLWTQPSTSPVAGRSEKAQ